MAIYTDRDIETDIDGDLILDQKGDIKLGNSLETYKAAANFVLRTDNGEYAPNNIIGCNLGSFIGEINSRSTHEHMEYNINKVLQERIFSVLDAQSDVVPFAIDSALCVVTIAGLYEVDGEIKSFDDTTLVYTFPYSEGTVTPLII